MDQIGKNVINAQISWGIYLLVSWAFFGVLTLIFIGFLFIWILPLVWIILSVVYTIKISNWVYTYQLPFALTENIQQGPSCATSGAAAFFESGYSVG